MLCHCPKLTPLQSRLAASVSTLAILALIYWSLSNPRFAYAAELAVDGSGSLRNGEDHNWHRIPDSVVLDDEAEEQDAEGLKAHTLLLAKRDNSTAQFQGNNMAMPFSAAAGSLTVLEYPNSLLSSEHADNGTGLPSALPGLADSQPDSGSGTTMYISANTCSQPQWTGTGTQDVDPPQLFLYVSQVAGNQDLGPSGSQQTVYNFTQGFVNAAVPGASGTWYMAVSAPSLSSNFTGSWTYEIAVSIDDYFHRADPLDFLVLVDTDDSSALLLSGNLTTDDANSTTYQSWVNTTAPFILFATNNNRTGYMGMESSFCGLQTFIRNNSQIEASQTDLDGNTTNVQMGITTRGSGQSPKQQFYIRNLNSSTPYTAFLAMNGNSTASGNGVVRGGGAILGSDVSFSTKADGNCNLIFNLTFCSEVAYAVPANSGNPNVSSLELLQNFYDNYTTTWYKLFNYTLAQIPCNTTSDAQYSMAKNCTDCAAAYKDWLCAVSIPRCEDFSNTAGYLQERNMGQEFWNNNSMLDNDILQQTYIPMSGAPTLPGSNAFQQTYISSFATNQSRNIAIDQTIKPGPYKEVLPCEDLCYSLMQSCPASMGFACPYPGRGLEASYGKRVDNGLECSYPGAYYPPKSDASAVGLIPAAWRVIVLVGLIGAVMAF